MKNTYEENGDGFGHLAICNKVLQDFHKGEKVQKRDVLFSPPHWIFAMI